MRTTDLAHAFLKAGTLSIGLWDSGALHSVCAKYRRMVGCISREERSVARFLEISKKVGLLR